MPMKKHHLKVYPSKKFLSKEDQLAYKLAEIALDPAPISSPAQEMAVNRIIDNAGVALAALQRPAPAHARDQALAYPSKTGASLFGLGKNCLVAPEWAAWANNTAVRELDFHDTFLAEDYSHPADNIPPILAVAQKMQKKGEDLLRGILAAYEIHISLVKGICLHKHKIDHIAHLCPAQIAGLGSLLNTDIDTLYQAIQHGVHIAWTTRQSRKGEISSWKAFAPAFAGKMAVEALDRALRGEKSPSPIYEGEDSVLSSLLDGPSASYEIPLIEKGEEKVSILESYTKAHSAEYQAQAFIDLAFELREKISDFSLVEKVTLYTSHHSHYVIGTGSGDPQKMDPEASRETLDHSLPYIFAVALLDGKWHHKDSYTRERARKSETVQLWQKIKTEEDPFWTKKYKAMDPSKKAFGGKAVIHIKGGGSLTGVKELSDAHPFGKRPFKREDYIQKFLSLSEGVVSLSEAESFLNLCGRLEDLSAEELGELNLWAEGLSFEPKSKGIL